VPDGVKLNYETPTAGPARFHSATIAAAVFCALGWFASVILMSGLGPFVTAANAVALGIAILGLLGSRVARGERIIQGVALVAALVGLFT
jgi:hypothetical protein